jgi:hypothetical protein
MIPNRRVGKEPTDLVPEEERESAEQILLEIREDARKLKNRYLKETIVAEGGE